MATDAQQAPRGTLRVTVPNAFGTLFAMGVLAEFKARYPELTLELVFLDRQVDLIGEGFDVALRVGELGDTRLIARRLASTDRIFLASPAYLERAGTPDEVAEAVLWLMSDKARYVAATVFNVSGGR